MPEGCRLGYVNLTYHLPSTLAAGTRLAGAIAMEHIAHGATPGETRRLSSDGQIFTCEMETVISFLAVPETEDSYSMIGMSIAPTRQ